MESLRPTGAVLADSVPRTEPAVTAPTVSPLVPVATGVLAVLALPVIVAGSEQTLRLALTAVLVTLGGVVWRLWLTGAVADDLGRRLARSVAPSILAVAEAPGTPPPLSHEAVAVALVAAIGSHSRQGQRPPVGVLVLAVDGLDAVRAEHDQRRVDEFVRSVADRLETVLTASERMIRVGEGRVAVITTAAPTDRDLELVAARLVSAATTVEPGGGTVAGRDPIGVSVGARAVTIGDDDPWAVLRDAEIACDRARSGGGDRIVVFDDDFRRQLLEGQRFDREFRNAVIHRNAVVHRQVDVHYQPIVTAVDRGDIVRLEALVRWSHPIRHLVLPGAILRSAERQGLIVELGVHILDRACEQASSWTQRSGRAVSVSVNLHRHQLRPEAEIERAATGALRRWSLDPAQLGVEVAVSAVVDDHEGVAACLARLAASGIAVALDGVGLGDDVGARLDSLPMVSCVKLDAAQLAGLDAPGLLPAVLGPVLERGVDLIVRNVERPEQLRALQETGATIGGRGRLLLQGFAIHRPASATALDGIVVGVADRPHRGR